MKQLIQCEVINTPAIMERLLRTVRVRGFSLESMKMNENNDCLSVELTVCGERPIDMLINQLAKLIDVNSVYHSSSITSELKLA